MSETGGQGATTQEGRDAQRRARGETPTQRVVLKRERVLVLPEGVTVADLGGKDAEAIRRALKIKGGKAHADAHTEAWVVVGEFAGDSQQKAIFSHTGKPGTPDAKVGDYKAVPVSSWKGGERLKAPPKPLVEREALED